MTGPEAGPVPPRNDYERIVEDAAIRAKVAQVVQLGGGRSEGWWASFSSNGLVNLIVGFILTGVIGTLVATRFQTAADNHRKEAELREIRRSQRLATLDTIGAVLNEGYYLYGIYYDTKLRKQPAETLRVRRLAFDHFNERLEKREILDAARVCAHFGRSANGEYVDVVSFFHILNPRLREYAGERVEGKSLGESVYRLRDDLFTLTTHLATAANDARPTATDSACRVPRPPSSGMGGSGW